MSHYFIAIPLPISLKNHFSYLQEELKKQLPYRHWPNKHDLHITLNFIGPIESERLYYLEKELKKIEDIEEFPVDVGSIGMFGNSNRPRVLWADVMKTKQLITLHEQIEICMSNLGFQKELRTYRPHITLAKKWDGLSVNNLLEAINSQFSMEIQTLKVNEVVLYKIFPSRTPKYEVIYKYRLKEGEQFGPVN